MNIFIGNTNKVYDLTPYTKLQKVIGNELVLVELINSLYINSKLPSNKGTVYDLEDNEIMVTGEGYFQ